MFLKVLIIILSVLILLSILFVIFYKFYFLRDPERITPKGNNVIAPADGVITLIKEFDKDNIDIEKKYLGKVKSFTSDVSEKGYIVSIFMNVFDVHINRAPINGTVKYVKHSDGKFLNAIGLDSTFENENVQILIEDKDFKVKMIQIAGLLARRIVPFAKENDKVIKGQRIGLIKLGSQVTLILPESVDIQVKIGQKVKAGETIIAKR